MSKYIAPKFDFSIEPPLAGDGQTHTSERTLKNSLRSSLFNELERSIVTVADAIGDYEFTDSIPCSADTVGDALRTVWSLHSNQIDTLDLEKVDKAGATMTGELVVGARVHARAVDIDWAAGVLYKVGDVVVYDKKIYRCKTQHTSTSFNSQIANWDLAGGGGSTSQDITLNDHGFLVGDVLYYDTGDPDGYVLAQADSFNTLGLFIVSKVADEDHFTIMSAGYFKDETGTISLTPGYWHYLSDTTPGGLTTTEPAISNPILYAISATEGYVVCWRPRNTASAHTQEFTATAGQTVFTLDYEPAASFLVWVSVDGTEQGPSNYSILGTALSFPTGLSVGSKIIVHYLYSVNFVPSASIHENTYTATPGQTAYTLTYAPIGAGYIFVHIDGLHQHGNFTIVGSTITMDTPATGGEKVSIKVIRTLNMTVPPDDSVTTAMIQDNQITFAKMADDSVGSGELIDGSVTWEKMADNSVGSGELIDGSVTQDKLAINSVGSGELIAGEVNNSHLADNTIESDKLKAGVIPPCGWVATFAGEDAPDGWLLCDGSSLSRSTYADLFGTLSASRGTITITEANPGVVTLASHGFITGDCISLTTDGALPTNLAENTNYYVIYVNASTFRLATTHANAVAGTAIDTSGSVQSGIHTLRYNPWKINGANSFYLPDLRGVSLEGAGTQGTAAWAAAEYTGRLGQYKQDHSQGHRHYQATAYAIGAVSGTLEAHNTNTNYGAGYYSPMVGNPTTDGTNGTPRTGKITAGPRVGVNYIIKY